MTNINEGDLNVNLNSDGEAASGSSEKHHNGADGSRQGHAGNVNPVFRENAQAAIECGWSPIPGRWKPGKNRDGSPRPPKDAKRPLLDNWHQFCDRQMTAAELAETYRKSPYAQLHLAMGFNDVIGVDRDTDCPLINRICDDILGRSNIARKGNKGRLDIFRVVGESIPGQKFLGKNESDPAKPGLPIIEFIGHGGNVRMYPSMHPENADGYISLTPDTIFDTTYEEVRTITLAQVEQLRAALAGFLYTKPERPAGERQRAKVDPTKLAETERKRYQAMADKQFADQIADLSTWKKGSGRATQVFKTMAALGVFIRKGFLDEATVEAAVIKAAKENGIWNDNGEKDVMQNIDHGFEQSKNDELPELKDRPGFRAKNGGGDQGGGTVPPEDGGPAEDPQDKPRIIVIPGEHDGIVAQAMSALVARDERLYQRGNKLVRPVVGEGVDSRGNIVHFSVLMEVDEAFMVRLLCRNIDWFRPDGRVKNGPMPGFRKIDAPDKIARAILKSAGDWPFKVVAGILNAPTLRHDGSILSQPGYDSRTHLYLQSSVALPAIPEHPTRAQAEEALTLLTDLMTEIPFVNESSKSVALSMMLSTVARTMFEVAPAHGARAPTAGTGKSYCADIVSAIVLGERCPVISVSEDNDGETEKRIIAKAMNGDQIINLDNVNGTLGGDTLCQLTERPTCDLRPLGSSKIVRVENRSIVFFNGNNVRVKGDMTRRVLIAELDRKMEKPAEYEFKNNPVKTVLADRGKYIAACMTILRAYQAAGAPKQSFPPMNSYGEWSACVRSALVWLGCADPCLTVQKARDEDPELQKIAAFCSAAKQHIGRQEFAIPSREIMKIGTKTNGSMGFGDAEPLHPELNEFLQEFIDRGKPNLHRLGNWLAKFQGRIVDGLRISPLWDSHKKVNRWFIEEVGGEYAAA